MKFILNTYLNYGKNYHVAYFVLTTYHSYTDRTNKIKGMSSKEKPVFILADKLPTIYDAAIAIQEYSPTTKGSQR